MADRIKAGTILIEKGALLPDTLRFESEPYTKGWNLVKNLDGYGMDRKVREAGWTFFYMANEIKASAFGFDREKSLCRAVTQAISNMNPDRLNSLEITRVVAKAFFGLRYVTISVHPRHIQESMELSRGKRIAEWNRAALAAAASHA